MAGKGPGRPPLPRVNEIILRDSQPEKWAKFFSPGAEELDPLDVMRENMTFFHFRAGELLATIMAIPLDPERAESAQLKALLDLCGVIKMRQEAQKAAEALAPYIHAKKVASAIPERNAEQKDEPEIVTVPTPQKVLDASERAAAGLPPLPRKTL